MRQGPSNPSTVIIVVPLYNHGATVRDVAERALKAHGRVMVVDDGSTDGGAETLEGLNVHLVRHDRNRGKGAALMTAAAEARAMGMTHMVTLDADGQHDPSEFPRFAEGIRTKPTAILVGRRDFDRAHLPKGRRFGRWFSNFWLRVQTGQAVGDAQCGFRAYPLEVLERLKVREKGFAFENEVLAKALWAGVEVADVDVSVYYPPPGIRVSHFRMFADNLRLSLLNARLTIRSMFPWPHCKIFPERNGAEKISFLHPMKSLRVLVKGRNSPERLAAAGALGAFLGALPLIACHMVAILFAAGYLRLNKIAAIAASQICMPPVVPAVCIEIGYFMRHGRFLTEASMETLGYQGLERLYEWFLGSLIVAPLLGVRHGRPHLRCRPFREERPQVALPKSRINSRGKQAFPDERGGRPAAAGVNGIHRSPFAGKDTGST
jgi:glycosyltransferase involved in cell wall biosynthesis